MKDPGIRRLVEVSLPLAQISEQSAREKSIRHGHISTLHIWWARRPLAAMRAAIFASPLIPVSDADALHAPVLHLVQNPAYRLLWEEIIPQVRYRGQLAGTRFEFDSSNTNVDKEHWSV